MNNFIKEYKQARVAATPLIAISTPDPAETMRAIQSASKNGGSNIPLGKWDVVSGAIGLNDAGAEMLTKICSDANATPDQVVNPIDILQFFEKAQAKSVLFMLNAHRYFEDQDNKQFIQALWNLRDVLKTKFCTVVLLGPSFKLPAELKQDILGIESPYPDEAELTGLVERLAKHNKVKLDEGQVVNTVDALRGLAPFSAESVVSMAMEKNEETGERTMDVPRVWTRKAQIIEEDEAMSVWRGGEGFDCLGGLGQSKGFYDDYIHGQAKIRLIAFVDEIEKGTLGSGANDSNGLGADIIGQQCTKMQDNGWTGGILWGHPGTGKSQLAKVIGNQAGVPTIYIDYGAMFGGIVGDTQKSSRNVFKVLEAMGGDGVLWLATCNERSLLKPELLRRFGLPMFFFDLPTEEERMAVKKIYCKKFGFNLKTFDLINDDGWTGAEIERCCKLAYDLRTTPDKTAKYIIPIARSSANVIDHRRKEADGTTLSASYDGIYQMKKNPLPVYDVDATRTLDLEN